MNLMQKIFLPVYDSNNDLLGLLSIYYSADIFLPFVSIVNIIVILFVACLWQFIIKRVFLASEVDHVS